MGAVDKVGLRLGTEGGLNRNLFLNEMEEELEWQQNRIGI